MKCNFLAFLLFTFSIYAADYSYIYIYKDTYGDGQRLKLSSLPRGANPMHYANWAGAVALGASAWGKNSNLKTWNDQAARWDTFSNGYSDVDHNYPNIATDGKKWCILFQWERNPKKITERWRDPILSCIGVDQNPSHTGLWKQNSISLTSVIGNRDYKHYSIASDGNRWCIAFQNTGGSNKSESVWIACTRNGGDPLNTAHWGNLDLKGKIYNGKPYLATDGARWCIASAIDHASNDIYLSCTAKTFQNPLNLSNWQGPKNMSSVIGDGDYLALASNGARWCLPHIGDVSHWLRISCTSSDGADPFVLDNWSSEAEAKNMGRTGQDPFSLTTAGQRWCEAHKGNSTTDLKLSCTRKNAQISPESPSSWENEVDVEKTVGTGKSPSIAGYRECYFPGEDAPSANSCCTNSFFPVYYQDGKCLPELTEPCQNGPYNLETESCPANINHAQARDLEIDANLAAFEYLATMVPDPNIRNSNGRLIAPPYITYSNEKPTSPISGLIVTEPFNQAGTQISVIRGINYPEDVNLTSSHQALAHAAHYKNAALRITRYILERDINLLYESLNQIKEANSKFELDNNEKQRDQSLAALKSKYDTIVKTPLTGTSEKVFSGNKESLFDHHSNTEAFAVGEAALFDIEENYFKRKIQIEEKFHQKLRTAQLLGAIEAWAYQNEPRFTGALSLDLFNDTGYIGGLFPATIEYPNTGYSVSAVYRFLNGASETYKDSSGFELENPGVRAWLIFDSYARLYQASKGTYIYRAQGHPGLPLWLLSQSLYAHQWTRHNDTTTTGNINTLLPIIHSLYANQGHDAQTENLVTTTKVITDEDDSAKNSMPLHSTATLMTFGKDQVNSFDYTNNSQSGSYMLNNSGSGNDAHAAAGGKRKNSEEVAVNTGNKSYKNNKDSKLHSSFGKAISKIGKSYPRLQKSIINLGNAQVTTNKSVLTPNEKKALYAKSSKPAQSTSSTKKKSGVSFLENEGSGPNAKGVKEADVENMLLETAISQQLDEQIMQEVDYSNLDDIDGNPDGDIFKIITKRYGLSAIPIFFREVKND